jgi:hypothetical protein
MGSGSDFAALALAAALLGITTGAEGDLLAYLASRYFGLRSFGQIAGLLYVPLGLAHAASPLLYAASRDLSGSYDSMLVTAMVLFSGGAGLLLAMGPYPDFAEGRTEPVGSSSGAVPAAKGGSSTA